MWCESPQLFILRSPTALSKWKAAISYLTLFFWEDVSPIIDNWTLFLCIFFAKPLKFTELFGIINLYENGKSITSENESLFSLNSFKMNISYEDLVSSINQLESILSNELNNNDSFVKQLNYRPYVNISYTKRINNNNINIENVTVRILLKAHHISIFKESKERINRL